MNTPVSQSRRSGPAKQVAQPARPTSDEFEAFWEQAPIGFGLVSADLRFVRVNESLARLLGRTRKQLLGSRISTCRAPVGAAAADACRRVLRSGHPLLDLQLRAPEPRGVQAQGVRSHDSPLVLSARPLQVGAGNGRLVALIVEDATRQQALQDSLDSRLQFEQLMGDLLTRFVDIRDDQVERAIGAALQKLGRFLEVDRITVGETDGETFRVLHSWTAPGIDTVPDTFSLSEIPWYAQRLLCGETVRIERIEDLPAEAELERTVMRLMGTKSHLGIPLSIAQGVVGALALGALRRPRAWPDELVHRLRLVGQLFATALGRKNANERLVRQQQELAHVGRVAAMGELSSILAHDLNQPLSAILTNAQATRRLVVQGGVSAEEVNEALADIAHDANRAGAIIRRLRALMRKGEPALNATDLNQLLADLEPILSAEVREYEVALKLELAKCLAPAQADAVQLQQVLLNLVSNACQAMSNVPRDQRELVIRTLRGGGGGGGGGGGSGDKVKDLVSIEVCDSGLPIPPAVFMRIFEPFFTTKATGLGMGLTITRSIVTAHGGRVWATQNPQRGITIRVALPACP